MTLQHVSLEVRRADVPAELAFWRLLGFAEVEPPGTLGERSAWLQRQATQVHLLFAEDPVVPPSGHAAVVAEEFDVTLAALRDADHEVEERTRHWGAARAFARTPAGHRVEVMAAPPPSRRGRRTTALAPAPWPGRGCAAKMPVMARIRLPRPAAGKSQRDLVRLSLIVCP